MFKSVRILTHIPTFYDDFSFCSSYNNWVTFITHETPTEHSLYSKYAHTVFSWYISTSGIGVVGGSGAAATV
jgi:hypothetical protein